MTLASRYEALVCDLDGVVYRGDPAVEYAVESLSASGLPVQYATNNASRPARSVAEHLRRLGLTLTDSSVATSSEAAAWVLQSHIDKGARVLAVGGPGVRDALDAAGFRAVTSMEDQPSAVVQGYGPDVTSTDLAQAAYAIQRGALWLATNTDLTLPTASGFAPGNGAFVNAVATAVGRGPDVTAGKPDKPLYLMCAERLGVAPDRVLAIGDRLETDIEGAHRAGMDSLLVLTGVHGVQDALAAEPERRPTWIARDLRCLVEDPAEVLTLQHALVQAWARRDAGEVDVADLTDLAPELLALT